MADPPLCLGCRCCLLLVLTFGKMKLGVVQECSDNWRDHGGLAMLNPASGEWSDETGTVIKAEEWETLYPLATLQCVYVGVVEKWWPGVVHPLTELRYCGIHVCF